MRRAPSVGYAGTLVRISGMPHPGSCRIVGSPVVVQQARTECAAKGEK